MVMQIKLVVVIVVDKQGDIQFIQSHEISTSFLKKDFRLLLPYKTGHIEFPPRL